MSYRLVAISINISGAKEEYTINMKSNDRGILLNEAVHFRTPFFKHSDHFGFYLLFVTLMYKKAWTTNSQALHVYSQGFFGLSVTPSVYDIS